MQHTYTARDGLMFEHLQVHSTYQSSGHVKKLTVIWYQAPIVAINSKSYTSMFHDHGQSTFCCMMLQYNSYNTRCRLDSTFFRSTFKPKCDRKSRHFHWGHTVYLAWINLYVHLASGLHLLMYVYVAGLPVTTRLAATR